LSKPDLLERALGEHGLPGISAAVFDGDSVSERALGDATPDTQYLIGSITKTFVAAALVALEIDLHAPLTRYGTPAQLLSHTSGLQRELPGDAWGTLEFPDREQIVESLDEAELVLPPGRWHYSNLGYVVLGELIRERAGTPFEDVISERLLDPLGLTRTTWEPLEPYARGTNRGAPEPPIDKGGARASGGLWSTAGDLARWARHLIQLDSLHRPFAHAGWDEAWGLGVACFRVEGRELWGHEGSSVGYQSVLLYDREARAGAAVARPACRSEPTSRRAAAARGRRAARLVVVGGRRAPLPLDGLARDRRGRVRPGRRRPLPHGYGPRGGRAAPRRPRRVGRAGRALVGGLSLPP
jgi:CubicO group peptidase (beta-lactamase class C family)